MADKTTINFNAQKITDKVFRPHGKGYDPDEVDDFLDLVAADYQAFEDYYLESKNYIGELETQLRKLKENYQTQEIENARMRQRLQGIKETDRVTEDNIDLLTRISKLETICYQHGIDISKIGS